MSRPWIGPVIIAAMFVIAAVAFPWLPEQIPTHWGFSGTPDAWAPRWPGAFYIPLIATAMWLLLRFLPKIDPRKRHYERFTDTYWYLLNFLALFFAAIQVFTYRAAVTGAEMGAMGIYILIGFLFVGLGNVMPRLKSNWWMGIRTPWTLESEEVWRSTHRVGGISFVLAGVLLIVGGFAGGLAFRGWLMGLAVAIAAGVPLVYSYLAWKKEKETDGDATER
jgi:immunity protein, SdpI family